GFDDYGGEISQRLPGFGFKIQPGPVNVADRVGAVRARLKLILSGGLPALVVDPRATVIKDGFAGGYHHERLADGNYSDKPQENWTHGTVLASGPGEDLGCGWGANSPAVLTTMWANPGNEVIFQKHNFQSLGPPHRLVNVRDEDLVAIITEERILPLNDWVLV